MNDILGDLLRDADPGTVRRGDALSERGQRELAKYEAAEDALEHKLPAFNPARRRRHTCHIPRIVQGAAMLALFAALVAAFGVFQLSPAMAQTPEMLRLSPVGANAPELLREMEILRRDGDSVGATIRTQTWALNTSVAEDGSIQTSVAEPQWRETVFDANGTVRFRAVTAEPFPGQDSDDLPAPGTALVEETFAAGAWDFPASSGPPTDSNAVGMYLSASAGEPELSTGQALREISGILSNYALSSEQESAIIGYLATLDTLTLTVAGETVDRLGRPGIVLTANDRAPGDYEDRLIVSPDTGMILASETIYVGSDRTDIESPSVIDYTAWLR